MNKKPAKGNAMLNLQALLQIVHHLASFGIAYSTMSLEEYGTHRWALHGTWVLRLFPKGLPTGPESIRAIFREWRANPAKPLAEYFKEWRRNYAISWRDSLAERLDDHAVSHHTHFFKCFRDE